MLNPTHILNGDALKEQFPSTIPGDLIILRECLSDGNVAGSTKEEFFKNRAKFIASHYEGYKEEDYFSEAVPELEKLRTIDSKQTVHLWFEKDLFCQVNMWYAIHTLVESGFSNGMYLILPTTDLEFGFGGMIESDLVIAFTDKKEVNGEHQKLFSELWIHYKNRNKEQLVKVSQKLIPDYDFIEDAVKACLEGMKTPGRPKDALKEIMQDLGTEEFGPVFREFSKRESIYGMGDLQVKRLLEELLN